MCDIVHVDGLQSLIAIYIRFACIMYLLSASLITLILVSDDNTKTHVNCAVTVTVRNLHYFILYSVSTNVPNVYESSHFHRITMDTRKRLTLNITLDYFFSTFPPETNQCNSRRATPLFVFW